MQGLHLNKFLKDFNGNIDESVLKELEIWSKENETDCLERGNSLVEQYENYSRKAMASEHGKAAKFWVIYIYNVNTYLVLHRAMKTNDFTLFVYALSQLSSIYFSTNHHNYARWMIVYALELLNIAEMLRNGGFTINRTGNPFRNVGVVMALEQTINAEAK